MIQAILPWVSSAVQVMVNEKEELSKKANVTPETIEQIGRVFQAYMVQDKSAQQRAVSLINEARKHDVETFSLDDVFANRLRTLVRPVCTFVALGWYVYARVYGISLLAEDYAIIGGVLAFWFGFRPFEKQSKRVL